MQDKERLDQKRMQVLSFCHKNKVGERSAWFCLAKRHLSQLIHNEVFLTGIKLEKNPFKPEHIKIRERILNLIPESDSGVCGDFIKLLNFSKGFMERIDYLVDSMLCNFLEKYLKQEYDPLDSKIIDPVVEFSDFLMEEFSAVWESTVIFPMDVVTCAYTKHLKMKS